MRTRIKLSTFCTIPDRDGVLTLNEDRAESPTRAFSLNQWDASRTIARHCAHTTLCPSHGLAAGRRQFHLTVCSQRRDGVAMQCRA